MCLFRKVFDSLSDILHLDTDTNEVTADDKGEVEPLKYGKVNFINRADKDVKIFEVSGIGEPTVLSPNFISTFFLKSPRESATFKAVDPMNNEEYLLNEQPALEVKLDSNPRIETQVQVTAPKTSRKSNAKKGQYLCYWNFTFLRDAYN